jgi:hypothetical protein
MANYKVKSWPVYFQQFLNGNKKHDMRDLRDRPYSVGDTLTLQEYDPFEGKYTGREQEVKITYVTSTQTPCALSSAMLDKNACILSIEKV